MRLLLMSGLAVFFAACGDKDTTSGDSGAEAIDADHPEGGLGDRGSAIGPGQVAPLVEQEQRRQRQAA